jgi:pilus assembly protein Flp/PilA
VIAIRLNMLMLLADRRGATAIEYGLIAALIVVAMMGALSGLGGGVGGMWTNLSSTAQSSM